MSVNKELLTDTMRFIETNPGNWDQDSWGAATSCGTVACLAGNAAILSGHRIVWSWLDTTEPGNIHGPWPTRRTEDHTQIPDGIHASMLYVEMPDGRKRHVEDAAQELLGLDDYDAAMLFDASNTLPRLRRMARNLLDGLPVDDDLPALDETDDDLVGAR